jgi:hypothetical protein
VIPYEFHSDCNTPMNDCKRVRASLKQFEFCFQEFVHAGLVESAYLTDEDYMCVGFYCSCMFMWSEVPLEFYSLHGPSLIQILQEFNFDECLEFECGAT